MTTTTELARWRVGLRLVQRDLDAWPGGDPDQRGEADDLDQAGTRRPQSLGTGLGGRFLLVTSEQGVFVALPDGRYWPGGAGPLPRLAGDPAAEPAACAEDIAAVALRAQECLAEILWYRWPRCPEHATTLRPTAPGSPADDADDADAGGVPTADEAAWSCDAGPGHRVAPIGRLSVALSAASRISPAG
jgi:hypothetical protein